MDCDGEYREYQIMQRCYTPRSRCITISLLGAVLPEKPQQPTLAKLHKERVESTSGNQAEDKYRTTAGYSTRDPRSKHRADQS
jgi:hypothetical protein